LKAENLEFHGLVCHVAKDDHRKNLINQTLEKYGGIDILVSNAATNPQFGSIFDVIFPDLDSFMIKINSQN